MTTPHEILNPAELAPPIGFSHVVTAAAGRTIFLGGQTAHDASGKLVAGGLIEQFTQASANVIAALEAAGAEPEHLVSMHIYVTNAALYRASLKELSTVYRLHFENHYPAISLFEVKGLFDPAALVELVCIAVVPDG